MGIVGFLTSVEGVITALVVVAGAVIALIKNMSKIQDALAEWQQKRTQRKNAYMERVLTDKFQEVDNKFDHRFTEMESKFDKIDARLDSVKAHDQQFENDIRKLAEHLQDISKMLFDNNEATATIALEKMMWAYHHYYLKGNPIPLDVRVALEAMYDQYKIQEWHNHIPEDFKEKIASCKIEGYEKEGT